MNEQTKELADKLFGHNKTADDKPITSQTSNRKRTAHIITVGRKYSNGETIANGILHSICPEHYLHPCYTKNLPWLNGLHLDFYIPAYRIAIEVDGGQHFKPTRWSNKMSNRDVLHRFHKTIANDHRKNVLCKNHNVNLLRVDVSNCHSSNDMYSILYKSITKFLKPYNKRKTKATPTTLKPQRRKYNRFTKDGFVKNRNGRLDTGFIVNVVIALKKINSKININKANDSLVYVKDGSYHLANNIYFRMIECQIEYRFGFKPAPLKVIKDGAFIYASKYRRDVNENRTSHYSREIKPGSMGKFLMFILNQTEIKRITLTALHKVYMAWTRKHNIVGTKTIKHFSSAVRYNVKHHYTQNLQVKDARWTRSSIIEYNEFIELYGVKSDKLAVSNVHDSSKACLIVK